MGKEEKKQYIWEYLLNNNEDIHFEQAMLWEPYAEVVEETEEQHCIYNAMYRYENIFLPYFQKTGIPKKQKEKVIFDICTHYLAQAEIKSSYSYRECIKRKIGQELENGMYGESVKEAYMNLPIEKKYLIMHYLDLQNRIMALGTAPCGSMEIYKKVVIQLLETGVIYKDRYREGKYILYVGEGKSDEEEKMIYLAQILFLPLEYSVEVLWDKHFGLLGEMQTLQLDMIRMM